MSNELAVVAPEVRAAQLLAFDETKGKLQALAKQSERIVEITGKAGYDECHAARMRLKNSRVDIERRGKEARDDANKFSKAVIAKEKELIGLIEPEELRLQTLQTEWDQAREQERLRKLEEERQRQIAIAGAIDAMRNMPASLIGKPSIIIKSQLAKLKEQVLDPEFFAERFRDAEDAHTAAVAKITEMLQAQLDQEAEQARIRAEREELERLRREADERRRADEDRAQREREESECREREARAERERQEREAREVEERRVAGIRKKIEAIRSFGQDLDNLSIDRFVDHLAALADLDPAAVTFGYAEFLDEAVQAYTETQQKIVGVRDARVAREEAERLERQRLEAQAEAQRVEQERLDRERAEHAAQVERDRLASLSLRDAAFAAVRWFHHNGHELQQVCTDLEHALGVEKVEKRQAAPVMRKARNAA